MAQSYEDKKQDALYDYENNARNAVKESNKTYDNMIAQSDKAYKDQINSLEEQVNNTDPVSQAMKEQTEFAIEKVEQQKEQAKKDYTKEQSAAYVDWQKQSDQYGVNAEQRASMGMANTGYAESSQVAMYTAYQNRVTAARESYNLAVQNFDNAMTEARLQNNSALAQIALEAQAKQLELSLQMVQQRNVLLSDKVNQKLKIESEQYSRYMSVLDQIYKDEALAEEKRQFNAQQKIAEGELAIDQQQLQIQKAQLELQKKNSSSRTGSRGKVSSGRKTSTAKGGASSTGGVINNSKKAQATLKGDSDEGSGDVNLNSVLSLGYGPISAAEAYRLVKEGIAETYKKNGVTYFRKSASTNKQFGLYKSLG